MMQKNRLSGTKGRMCRWCLMIMLFCGMLTSIEMGTVEASGAVTAQIPVSCTGKNTTEQFLYKLEGIQSEEEADETEMTLKDGEKGCFSVTYSTPGIYHYTVTQKKGTEEKTTYDTRTYQVKVGVYWDETEHLKTDVVIYMDGKSQKYPEAGFENEKETETETEKKGGSTGTVSAKNAKTGDETPLAVWICLLIGAAGGVFAVLTKKRGERTDGT